MQQPNQNKKTKADLLNGITSGSRTLSELMEGQVYFLELSHDPSGKVVFSKTGEQIPDNDIEACIADTRLKNKGLLVWSEIKTYNKAEA